MCLCMCVRVCARIWREWGVRELRACIAAKYQEFETVTQEHKQVSLTSSFKNKQTNCKHKVVLRARALSTQLCHESVLKCLIGTPLYL